MDVFSTVTAELQQPLPGLGVVCQGPRQLTVQDGVESSSTDHAPFSRGVERCASVYLNRQWWSEKIRSGAIPRGGCRRGKG
jgi:hypothetical protein